MGKRASGVTLYLSLFNVAFLPLKGFNLILTLSKELTIIFLLLAQLLFGSQEDGCIFVWLLS